MANSHLTIFPSNGFWRTCCPRVRSEWRQALDEEQKVRRGGEEGRGGGAQQYNLELPCPRHPKVLQPFMTQYSTIQLHVHGKLAHTTFTTLFSHQTTKVGVDFARHDRNFFVRSKRPISFHLSSLSAVELQCVVYDPSVVTGGRQSTNPRSPVSQPLLLHFASLDLTGPKLESGGREGAFNISSKSCLATTIRPVEWGQHKANNLM